ncbi:MAG: hypothetical protein Q7S16_03470 [bacterium]|nr:hypothetical protein [bacterium]
MNKKIKQSIDVIQYLKNKTFKRDYDDYGKQIVRLSTGKLLQRASADYKKGKNISPVFSDNNKMLVYLHSYKKEKAPEGRNLKG